MVDFSGKNTLISFSFVITLRELRKQVLIEGKTLSKEGKRKGLVIGCGAFVG